MLQARFSEAWTSMVRQWCFRVKPYIEQTLVVEGAKPSMMEATIIPTVPQLKRIVFGRIFPTKEHEYTFRRDQNTTFLAYDPDSGVESQVESFFKRYENSTIRTDDRTSWKEFHAEIGALLGYPKVAREAYGERKIVPSFYDAVGHASWARYPFTSFSPATYLIQEAVDVNRKNKMVLRQTDLGGFLLQYSEWFEIAQTVWQRKKEDEEALEHIVLISQKLLNQSRQIDRRFNVADAKE
jgi:hypothetical protein